MKRGQMAGLASALSPKHHHLTPEDRQKGQKVRSLASRRQLIGRTPQDIYRLGYKAGWYAGRKVKE